MGAKRNLWVVGLALVGCGGQSRSVESTGGSAGSTSGGAAGMGGADSGGGSGTSGVGASAGEAPCGSEAPGTTRRAHEFDGLWFATVAGFGRCGDDLCMGGGFEGTLHFDQELVAVGPQDGFIAKVSSDGEPIWSHRIGGSTEGHRFVPTSFAAAPDGGVALAGVYEGEVRLPTPGGGEMTLEATGSSGESIIARFHDDGTLAWLVELGETNAFPSGTALAFDPSGVLVVAAAYGGSLATELMVAAYEPDGSERFSWTSQPGGMPTVLELDASGNIFIGGFFGGGLVVPDGGEGTTLEASGTAICVVSLDPSGLYRFSHCPDGDNQQIIEPVLAVGADGDFVVAGGFTGRLGFSPRPGDSVPTEFLTSTDEREDIYVAKFDREGTLLWQEQFGAAHDQKVSLGLAVGSNGEVVLAGASWRTFDFGEGSTPLVADFQGAFLAELDAAGRHVWSRHLGDAYVSGKRGLILGECDTLTLAVRYQGYAREDGENEFADVGGILIAELAR